MNPSPQVCARCGEPAGDQRFCGSCGLNLSVQEELPTRAAWEAAQATPGQRAPDSEQDHPRRREDNEPARDTGSSLQPAQRVRRALSAWYRHGAEWYDKQSKQRKVTVLFGVPFAVLLVVVVITVATATPVPSEGQLCTSANTSEIDAWVESKRSAIPTGVDLHGVEDEAASMCKVARDASMSESFSERLFATSVGLAREKQDQAERHLPVFQAGLLMEEQLEAKGGGKVKVSCPERQQSLEVGESVRCNVAFPDGTSRVFELTFEGGKHIKVGGPVESTSTSSESASAASSESTPTTSTESTETTPTTSTEPTKTTPFASTAASCPSGPIRTGAEQAAIESITASSTSCAAALRFVKDWAAINSKEPPAGFSHNLDGYTCTLEGGGARYSEVCHDQSKQVSFVVQWE